MCPYPAGAPVQRWDREVGPDRAPRPRDAARPGRRRATDRESGAAHRPPPGLEHRPLWRRRGRQVAVDPAAAARVTGVVWASEIGTTVGRGGFHGPPDGSGMVEVGYARSIPRTGRRGTRGPRSPPRWSCGEGTGGHHGAGERTAGQHSLNRAGRLLRLRRGRSAVGRGGRPEDRVRATRVIHATAGMGRSRP